MNKTEKKKNRSGVFASFIFAFELFFLADMLYARSQSNLPLMLGAVIFASSLFFVIILGKLNSKAPRILVFVFTLLIAAAAAGVYYMLNDLYNNGIYETNDRGKSSLYGGRNVMVLVPHEDDEINLMGGVLEEYRKYGSQVTVVYLTNGDMSVSAERRFDEAIEAMRLCGIPENNLVFMGYGDSLFKDGIEIYFLDPDTVVESHAGKTQTYGTHNHPAYREGRDYTLNNMYEDLRDVILEHKPDTIFCCGYDEHADHRLLSLLFDRAMGEILKRNSDYKPDVFKGFAYTTAYYAPQDFYQLNLLSTLKPGTEPFMQEDNVFMWTDRLRFPVSAPSLSRSILSGNMYRALSCYSSQETIKMADGIINGDRVFWQRELGSKLYYTDVEASSGDASAVNDFMLTDRKNPQLTWEPSQNLWIPKAWDGQKEVIFKFTEPTVVSRIKLYDNPSLEDNILDAVITLDGGTEIHTGPLPKNGTAGEFEFGERTLTRISVSIKETEGLRAGLAEIEAFEKPFRRDFRYLKLMNENGDFVYDYYIDPSGQESFGLYIRGAGAEQLMLKVSCQGGSNCRAKLENGLLKVTCPEGESCYVTVASADGSCMDTVHIRNGSTKKILIAQQLEKYLRKEFSVGLSNSNSWKALRYIKDLYLSIASTNTSV